MSQLAGALAIVSGLAPEERWARIVDTITDPDRLVMRAWTGDGHGGSPWKVDAPGARGLLRGRLGCGKPGRARPALYVLCGSRRRRLAGAADRLPDLVRRWSQFLVDGYDTLGECWDYGTHVHGWSSTPARDLVFYTLGVTPPSRGLRQRASHLGWAAWPGREGECPRLKA